MTFVDGQFWLGLFGRGVEVVQGGRLRRLVRHRVAAPSSCGAAVREGEFVELVRAMPWWNIAVLWRHKKRRGEVFHQASISGRNPPFEPGSGPDPGTYPNFSTRVGDALKTGVNSPLVSLLTLKSISDCHINK